MKITQQNYKTLRFIPYVRKSQDSEDRQIESIPEQIKELEEIANRERLILACEPVVETQSAYKPGRPEFQRVINRIKNGEADGILVWQTSRLARNYEEMGQILQLLKDDVIKAIKTKDALYTKETDQTFMLSLNLSMDHQFSAKISDGVHRGNKHKVLTKHEWGNKAKPGYINKHSDTEDRHWIESDPERFPIIQKALKDIIYGGLSPNRALDRLNNEYGYLSRRTKRQGAKPMKKSQWYRLLADSYYCGDLTYKIEGEYQTTYGSHRAMLTKEEFEILQTRIGKKSKAHKFQPLYINLTKCGECSSDMVAEEKWQIICSNCHHKFARTTTREACPYCQVKIVSMINPKILHYVYYTCLNHKKHGGCKQKTITINAIDTALLEELRGYRLDEDFTKWCLKYLHELNNSEQADQSAILHNLQKKQLRLQERKQKLLNLKLDGDDLISDEDYKLQKQAIEKEQAGITEKMSKLNLKESQWMTLAEQTFDFAINAPSWFINGTDADRELIASQICSNLFLKDKKVLVEAKKPWYLIEKVKKSMDEIKREFEPELKTDASSNFDQFYDTSPQLLPD